MPGAPNCQNPVWSPAELAIIGRAWSVLEAARNHLFTSQEWMFATSKEFLPLDLFPYRTYKAIECKWIQLHPKLPNRNTSLEREIGLALDKLEATVS